MKEPIRKRGYHRALKRGEMWALLRKSMLDMMRKMTEDFFKPSPFEKMWEANAQMMGLSETIGIPRLNRPSEEKKDG